ncbi:MAG: zinc ribbon domain-containing protein [Mahellales bacterium]|jgi:predicted  nucleic acid-binding Zn-ribbon protein
MEQLMTLWQYQEQDLYMDKLQHQKKSLPLRNKLIRLRDIIFEQQTLLHKINDDLEKKRHIFNELNMEYEKLVENLKADHEKLYSGDVKSAKQLEQLRKNAEEYREKVKAKEERLLKLDEEIDKLNTTLADLRVKSTKARKEYKELKSAYDAELEIIKSSLDNAKKQKTELESRLDADLLKKYKNLRKDKQTVIAELIGDKCSGCNMSLPSMVAKQVKDGEKIVECENCGRILFIKSDV